MANQITVSNIIHVNAGKAWNYYTSPEHITQWNFADPSWHCPSADNDLRIGGKYYARMEAKDGSYGFDFEAIYTHMDEGKSYSYEFGGRHATVTFEVMENDQTKVTVSFEPETTHSHEMQQAGWQAILDNYKKYTEGN